MPDPLEISPARLLEVADMVLRVFEKGHGVSSRTGVAEVLIGEVSAFEADQAVQFLIRCGLVERVIK